MLLVLVMAAAAAPVRAEEPVQRDKEAKVRELLELTGAADMGKQTMDAMLEHFARMPGLPAGFIDRFKKIARPEDLLELVVPIYMKHYDVETVDALLVFYRTPAGGKMLQVQSQIMSESMEAGRKWGEQLARRALAGDDGNDADDGGNDREYLASKVEDLSHVRDMVGLIAVCGKIPMKDGRVDVFAVAGELDPSKYYVFRSARSGAGPSDEEIERGDYKNFPYERFRGQVKRGAAESVPLIWDKKPDARNGRIVGFSGGAAKYLGEAEVQALLKRHGQLAPAATPETEPEPRPGAEPEPQPTPER
jgi:hypothetical protein